MITIVMTYFNRPKQLEKTLLSLKSSVDFRVVVVDDSSNIPPVIPHNLTYPIDVIRTNNKTWTNPEPALNLGLLYACENNSDIVIIQNAECYHNGNIIDYASTITPEKYYSFACYSIDEKSTETGVFTIHPKGARKDGECAWYNHSIYRPVAYDFCSAITIDNIKLLNGFDERLSSGWGFGDNYFLERIKMLGISVQIVDDPFVIHQWHYTERKNDISDLITQNKHLYHELLKEKNYKAQHLITKDL